MIAIIDYDAGNLKSVEKAFLALGEECVVTRDHDSIRRADRVVLPGVGSFGTAMQQLKKYELDQVIREVVQEDKPYVYFVHSYYLKAKDPSIVKATTECGVTIHASVEKGNLFACQFHPEKSSTVGLQILKNFAEI